MKRTLFLILLSGMLLAALPWGVSAERSVFDMDFEQMETGTWDQSSEAAKKWGSVTAPATMTVEQEEGNQFLQVGCYRRCSKKSKPLFYQLGAGRQNG